MNRLVGTFNRLRSSRAPQEKNIILSKPTSVDKSALRMILIPVGVFLAAEIAASFVNALTAAVMYSLMLAGLANLYFFWRESVNTSVWLALMLLPLMRLLNLVIPIPKSTLWLGYAFIGLPLVLASWFVGRISQYLPLTFRLERKERLNQALFGLIGIPLGFFAFHTLPPVSFLPAVSSPWIVIAAGVLILFGALLEEFIFRGILQQAFIDRFGKGGVIFTSVLYGSMSLPLHSAIAFLFYTLVSLGFALWVKKTGSLWGVVLAHSLLNILFWLNLP